MSFEIVEKGGVLRNVMVNVSRAELGGEEEKSYAALRRQTKVKGFRKGKVPNRVLKMMYGKRVRDEAVERLIMSKVQSVLAELSGGGQDVLHMTPWRITKDVSDQGFAFELDVELRPEVDAKGYLGLSAEKEAWAVSEEDVEDTLKGLRSRFATLEEIGDRDEAQSGDVVSINFAARGEGPLADFKGEHQPVELGAGEVLEGLEEGLMGAKVGDALEVEITLPDPYPATPSLAGEKVMLDVEIEWLKVKVLPELDDDFAVKTGRAETVEELRALVEKELGEEKERAAAAKAKELLVDALLSEHSLDLPELYVEERIARRRQHRQMLMGPEADMGDLEDSVRRDVHNELILDAIAERESVEVEPKDVREYLAEQAALLGMSLTELQRRYSSPESRSVLVAEIRRDRALDLVYDNAELGEAAAADEDDEEEDTSSGEDDVDEEDGEEEAEA